MSATALAAPTLVTRSGVAPVAPVAMDATNGNTVTNDGRTCIEITNTNASSTAHTLTVAIAKTVDGQTVEPRTYSIAAGATLRLYGFPVADYGGILTLGADSAELTIAAYRYA
jgi:hypothetical protein